MVDFQLDIYNKLHLEGEETKGSLLFTVKTTINKLNFFYSRINSKT